MAPTTEELQATIDQLEQKIKRLETCGEEVIPANQKKKSRDYSTTKYVPKNPLGMTDYGPEDMVIREEVMHKIRSIFKLHGAVEIETPVVELKSTLTGKYGEDTKLIYDLKDQGGEILALRYDLTVPFARYCAQHKVETLKRYHIARVYRRDRPVMSKGRFREFYQCDLDIAGTYHPMTADAECLKIVVDCLKILNINFKVKVNHRKVLDGIFQVCGVKDELLRPICSAVDKLDKLPWDQVKEEMIQKGITEEEAEHIWSFVQHSGGKGLVDKLLLDEKLQQNPSAEEGLKELQSLFGYLEAFGVDVGNELVFDLSLARGLDYYTGMIFEAVAVGDTKIDEKTGKGEERIGSVAGGGRYDKLVGMFKKKKKEVPCVGLSLGIERLFVLVGDQAEKKKLNATQVLVCAIGAKSEEREAILTERMKILNALWAEGIAAETVYKLNPKALTQFQQCEDSHIPIAVIVAPEELSRGVVKIRRIEAREEEEVSVAEVVSRIASLLAQQ